MNIFRLQNDGRAASAWEITAVATILVVGILLFWQPALTTSRTSPKGQCGNNLARIEDAKEHWAMETWQPSGAAADVNAINRWIKDGIPKCPSDGKYTYGKIDEPARCSIAGHTR
jgi:hypothetical protein